MTGASQTHIGYVRDENQDRVEVRAFGENLLAVVCDGMGGERSGSKASSMAVDVFFEHFTEKYVPEMSVLDIRALLMSAVSAANSVVYTSARMNYQNFGMGTTCVAAFVSDTYIAVVNVGDSRAYLLTNGGMEQITADHTLVRMLIERGEITEEQAQTHPQRHMLIKAVGVERTVTPDFFCVNKSEAQPFRLLLCSDGLCGFCTDAEMQAVLESEGTAEELTQRLTELALSKGGRDNTSVAVICETDREKEGGTE